MALSSYPKLRAKFQVNGHLFEALNFGGMYQLEDFPDCEDSRARSFTLHPQEFHILSFILGIQKRISHKRTKNKAKNDKTDHGMEKCVKTNPKSKPKVNHVKKSSEKSKSKSTLTKSESTPRSRSRKDNLRD
ncbi:hypothetical protein Tco_0129059 [Tanacetum coccineum]